MTAAITSHAGTYAALCGTKVLPAPLPDSPTARCFACLTISRAQRAHHYRELQTTHPRHRHRCRLLRFGRHQ